MREVDTQSYFGEPVTAVKREERTKRWRDGIHKISPREQPLLSIAKPLLSDREDALAIVMNV